MIAGRSCLLRPFRDDDVRVLPQTIGRPEVVRYLSQHVPHPYTLEDARAWVETERVRDPLGNFVVEVDGAFADGAGFMPLEGEHAGVADIGYWLAPAFWGRGIATDAARTLAKHAFRTQGFRRLNAWVMAPNRASCVVLERAGFTLEGILRRHLTARDGEICDAAFYGRLATDPEPLAT